MKSLKKPFLLFCLIIFYSCGENDIASDYTGNEVTYELIPGSVNGNETTGTLVIREKTDGSAQLDIEINNVLNNANHPAHLHYGSLVDNGNIATMLNPVLETDGVGYSSTIITALEDGSTLSFSELRNFNGSIKIHFEATGSLKDELIASSNIGSNSDQNQAYLDGAESIMTCNSDF